MGLPPKEDLGVGAAIFHCLTEGNNSGWPALQDVVCCFTSGIREREGPVDE